MRWALISRDPLSILLSVGCAQRWLQGVWGMAEVVGLEWIIERIYIKEWTVDTTIRAQEAIPARIDRLPVSRELWRIMLLAGVACLVESYDVGVIGSVLPSLVKEFHLGAISLGLLAIASTLGIVIAVIPTGWVADTIGRKKMLVIGTAWYAVFSLLCGFAPTLTVLVLL